MTETELAIALSAREWPDRLRRFLADHGGARVRVAAMGPEDLLAESYDVLIIDDICSFLTPRLVDLVDQRGRLVLGVYDAQEFADGRERLKECGVSQVIEADADAEVFLEVISSMRSTLDVAIPVAESIEVEQPSAPPGKPGATVIAVGGPTGGTGATEVAVSLAARLADRAPTVLVEVDETAPSLAQRMGLPLYPNLRTAIDVLEHRSGSIDRVLHRPGPLWVLPGLANARDWHEVKPRQVIDLLGELASTHEWIVVNVGSRIEADGFGDGHARFGVSRAVIQSCGGLVAVGTASPIGVARLLDWLALAGDLADAPRAHVLVNRAPPDQFRRAELLDEVRRTYSPVSFGFLPEDPRLQGHGWDGTIPNRGRFRRALDRWADRFLEAS